MRPLAVFGVIVFAVVGLGVFLLAVPIPVILGILKPWDAVVSVVGCAQLWTRRRDTEFMQTSCILTLLVTVLGPPLNMPYATLMTAYGLLSVSSLLLLLKLVTR